ncbi:HVO_2072 family ArtA-dependent S-layer glycoprotein [Halomicroarcula sp. GCM10025709]
MTALMVLSVVAISAPAAAAPGASLSASTDAGTVQPGDTFEVTYTLENTGDDPGPAGAISLDTPSGITAVSASGDGRPALDGSPPSVIFGLLGPVNSGDSVTTTVTYEVDAGASDDDYTVDANGELRDNSTSATDSVSTTVTVSSDTSPEPPETGSRGAGPYDTSTSVGEVGNGATIFQGEDDITFVGDNGDEISPAAIERTAGANEGVPLRLPIPQDQAIGSYSNGAGFTVTVQEPEINTFEIQNNDGADVSGGVLTTDQTEAAAFVEYNFEDAEDVELSVEDENGLDVTDEIVTGVQTRNGDGTISFDPSAVDAGDYTFTISGVEDLDFGDASQSTTVTITSERTASLNLDSEEVVQGENLGFTIEDSPEGNYHAVAISSNQFRDGVSVDQAADIFRNVGDVSESGVLVENGNPEAISSTEADDANADINDVQYAYAIVEIDGGEGVGSIETQYLDSASIDTELYQASGTTVDYAPNGAHIDANLEDTDVSVDDEPSFEVTEGEISLESPTGAYVVGSEVDVNGTANEGVDDVAIYARDNNDFELVTSGEFDNGGTVISVDSDNSFDVEDVTLSDGETGGNDILSLPGTYRLGVIDATDADIDGDGEVDSRLSTSDFNSGVSSTSSIRVTDTELNGTFITYDGDIATQDSQIDVEGTAPGKSNVVIAFVDERGNAQAHVVSVDSDGTFDEEELNIGTLSEGTVSGHIISSGRDGQFGDNNFDEDDFADRIENTYATGSSSGNQVRDRIVANSIDDTASDDLMVTETFRLADGLTSIESINSPAEVGGTFEINGTSNRDPEDTTITVELLDASGESVTLDSTEEWGTDGQWNLSLEVPEGVEPGNYTVESDDGDSTDRVSVQIVEEGSLEEPTPTPAEEPTPTPTEEPTDEPTATPTPTEQPTTEMSTPTDEPTTTSQDGPGFTAVIALVALVAAALLAVRRNN